jgi:hypothetical protein
LGLLEQQLKTLPTTVPLGRIKLALSPEESVKKSMQQIKSIKKVK